MLFSCIFVFKQITVCWYVVVVPQIILMIQFAATLCAKYHTFISRFGNNVEQCIDQNEKMKSVIHRNVMFHLH